MPKKSFVFTVNSVLGPLRNPNLTVVLAPNDFFFFCTALSSMDVNYSFNQTAMVTSSHNKITLMSMCLSGDERGIMQIRQLLQHSNQNEYFHE